MHILKKSKIENKKKIRKKRFFIALSFEGGFCEGSGRVLGGFWEGFGRILGGFWEAQILDFRIFFVVFSMQIL